MNIEDQISENGDLTLYLHADVDELKELQEKMLKNSTDVESEFMEELYERYRFFQDDEKMLIGDMTSATILTNLPNVEITKQKNPFTKIAVDSASMGSEEYLHSRSYMD